MIFKLGFRLDCDLDSFIAKLLACPAKLHCLYNFLISQLFETHSLTCPPPNHCRPCNQAADQQRTGTRPGS